MTTAEVPLGKYKVVECTRGREWICRISTNEDVYYGIQQFAKDYNIRFAKIHAAFMGGFEPAKFMIWTPDARDPSNWHYETEMAVQNQSMLLSMNGFIHLRKAKDGGYEPFPAIHYVIGAAWNVPTVGGHLVPGTIAKGNLEFFITEILGIDVLIPESELNSRAPESWYISTK